ncbi:hypothetical protein [Aquimarina litoralis]|uniref:hypothetical protein n=1 Tax=Aquimarina litoralis TaxID=584605 RepID=UPI001C56B74A|nr:hypothetical protein [Aquimarina litoralis]MBW1298656.1 hypothetical protein [Aquimarina litoralis]
MINQESAQERRTEVFKDFVYKLSLLALISILYFSCAQEKNLKQLDFYGTVINVPNYLITDEKKTKTKSCERNYYLKSKKGTISVSFELCNYAYKERPNFDLLNRYFEQGVEVMKNEFSNFNLINKESYNKKEEFYEFTYEFTDDGKFYRTTRFAYENFYIGVKIEGKGKKEVYNLSKYLEIMKNDKFLSNIKITDSDKNSTCLSCFFPSPW